jgi:hypothetical protein
MYLSPRAATTLISSMRRSWTVVALEVLGAKAGQLLMLDTVAAVATVVYPKSANFTRNISVDGQ